MRKEKSFSTKSDSIEKILRGLQNHKEEIESIRYIEEGDLIKSRTVEIKLKDFVPNNEPDRPSFREGEPGDPTEGRK